ncbi:DUF4365 domain-containing protein [Candidatus Albibeggiatoa sp. nov. NOAA]|uniref:DUF4365 domain-containing protein n=1 Tax=Candidatus Albibeggiatoa sp. nov. NOAA TaxID=3162724 RepID=UPI0032F134F9|nr:DUF4365 domain-containing protein [Thiotrichaceae bacterium]
MNDKPRRTREHIIADLSHHHLEYFILKQGFTFERVDNDYGYDVQIFFYDEQGFCENGQVLIQLKATDNIERYLRTNAVAYPVQTAHLRLWAGELYPVILVLYDAQHECAYWLYIQTYLQSLSELEHKRLYTQKSLTIYFPLTNKLELSTLKTWQMYKNEILNAVAMEIRTC